MKNKPKPYPDPGFMLHFLVDETCSYRDSLLPESFRDSDPEPRPYVDRV